MNNTDLARIPDALKSRPSRASLDLACAMADWVRSKTGKDHVYMFEPILRKGLLRHVNELSSLTLGRGAENVAVWIVVFKDMNQKYHSINVKLEPDVEPYSTVALTTVFDAVLKDIKC